MAIQPDGKIVAVGRAYNGSNVDFAIVRYNTDGSPDTSFDSSDRMKAIGICSEAHKALPEFTLAQTATSRRRTRSSDKAPVSKIV